MTLSHQDRKIITDSIRDIKDFPKAGIVFKDITTLLNNPKAFNILLEHLKDRYSSYNLTHIAGIESRGFMFAAPLAQMLGVGFVPIRKKGKLPYTTISEKYALEYGFDEVEIHIDAFSSSDNPKVLLIDDLLATGGTASASASLIKQAGAECVEACFIIGLGFLDGDKKVSSYTKTYTIIEVD